MAESTVLNLILWLPVLGMVALLLAPRGTDGAVRGFTLGVMLLQLALTGWLYLRFDGSVAGLQFETRIPWIADWGVNYHIGLDGLNVLLVALTAFLGRWWWRARSPPSRRT
jgi:NADH-quinone oxidoreductase subunit M